MANEAAIFANKLLEQSFKRSASDIHFHPSPLSPSVLIYFRILGNRTYVQTISKTFYQIILSYFKFSSRMDIGETRRPQNGTMTHTTNANDIYHLRLSTLP